MGHNPFSGTRYLVDRTYFIPDLRPQSFAVQSQSNDDIDMKFLERVVARLRATNAEHPDLIAALCPTRERRNSMVDNLRNAVWDQFDHFHFYLLEYKWDLQAKLLLEEVESHIAEIVQPFDCHRILGPNIHNRSLRVLRYFQQIYPL